MGEANPAILQSYIHILNKRATEADVASGDVMGAMNALQQILIPKHQSAFIPHLAAILDSLLGLCDDKDVSVRHTACVVLNSSVTVILPYQKSVILNFLASRCKRIFKPHALVALLEIEIKVTQFLTYKVAKELFSESVSLLNYCAKSSSEIVAEGFFKLAPEIRRFFDDKDQRLKLIKCFGKKKESVLSTRWAIKCAAVFAYPDLIDESVKMVSNQLEFLAAVPSDVIPDSFPENAPLDELVPFVEREPARFFEVLKEPPTDPRSLAAFFLCMKFAIPSGYNPTFPLTVFSSMDNSNDMTIFSHQIECFALMALRGVFERRFIHEVFRDALNLKNPSCVFALALVFNKYPSVQLFNKVLQIPTKSPSMCKSLIQFFTEVDFDHVLESTRLHRKTIDKLVNISHSSHETVQNSLLERLKYFNNGRTYPLFRSLFSELDLFEPRGFRNGITLLAELATHECKEEINTLFVQCQEVDQMLLWGDAVSLNVFLRAVKKFCLAVPDAKVPLFFAELPLLVLRAIIAVLNGEWDENIPGDQKYNKLLESVKTSTLLKSVILKQPLTSLLEIRDEAASCAAAIRINYPKVYDPKTVDLLGRKLIPWPSKKIWLLIGKSAKQLILTTSGALSPDPKIAFAAAMKCPDKFTPSMISEDVRLQAFAVAHGMDAEYELTPEFVKYIDKIASELPETISEKLRGSWMVVYLRKHLASKLVEDFCSTPFENWDGPRKFWSALPDFLRCMKKYNGWSPVLQNDAKLNGKQQFFSARYIHLFVHDPIADYAEIQLKSRSTPNFRYEPVVLSDYYDFEMIRGMRMTMYKALGCNTFKDLLKVQKTFPHPDTLFESILNFAESQDCDNDAFPEIILFALELLSLKQTNVDILGLGTFAHWAPFRGYSSQYTEFSQRNSRNIIPLPSVPDRAFLESEMYRMLPVTVQMGQRVKFPVQALSHKAMHLMAKMTPQSFSVCCRYMVCPSYDKDNEKKLLKQIEQFGITRFVIKTAERWCAENDIIHVINAILTVAARDGTYNAGKIAKAMGNAMFLHKSVIPVVEAFVLALDDSPLKKALEAEFRSAPGKH